MPSVCVAKTLPNNLQSRDLRILPVSFVYNYYWSLGYFKSDPLLVIHLITLICRRCAFP